MQTINIVINGPEEEAARKEILNHVFEVLKNASSEIQVSTEQKEKKADLKIPKFLEGYRRPEPWPEGGNYE